MPPSGAWRICYPDGNAVNPLLHLRSVYYGDVDGKLRVSNRFFALYFRLRDRFEGPMLSGCVTHKF